MLNSYEWVICIKINDDQNMNHAFKNCRMLCVYVYHHTFIESESFKNLIPCKYTCVETGKVQCLFDTYQIYVANVYDAIFQSRYI